LSVVLLIVACFLLTRFSATGEVPCVCRPVEVPWADHGEELVLGPVIELRAGEIIVGGHLVQLERLPAELAALVQQHAALRAQFGEPPAPLTVLIAAEKQASFAALRPLMAAAWAGGAVSVSLVVLGPG
jgi:biopolymer transport protein ExbD